jgi:hypothetical protein
MMSYVINECTNWENVCYRNYKVKTLLKDYLQKNFNISNLTQIH